MLWSNGMSVSDLESEEDGVRVGLASSPNPSPNLHQVSDLKSEEDGVAFQLKLMDMQMFLEDTFCELAERTGQVRPNHHPNPNPNPNPDPNPNPTLTARCPSSFQWCYTT